VLVFLLNQILVLIHQVQVRQSVSYCSFRNCSTDAWNADPPMKYHAGICGACSWRSSCQALPHFIQEVNDEKLLCPMIGSIRFTISQVCNSLTTRAKRVGC
jgi:hypothetical protein